MSDHLVGLRMLPGMGAKERSVAEEAAAAVLALPEARLNGALPSLAGYLAFEAPAVDPLPFFFLRECWEDPALPGRARRFAVGGRLLVARVRWLDEMIDSGRPAGTPDEVHRLSTAVHSEALSYFESGFEGARGAGEFLGLLAGLEARYAVSLAVDACSSGVLAKPGTFARVGLGAYAEQAKARAMVASAAVEAVLLVAGATDCDRSRARRCLGAFAVAWQLYDDVLDLEEDYRDGRLSWIVSETLRGLPGDRPLPEPDAFYEAALLGGHVLRALEESLASYHEAEQAAGDLFPRIARFLAEETLKTEEMISDLAEIVVPAPK